MIHTLAAWSAAVNKQLIYNRDAADPNSTMQHDTFIMQLLTPAVVISLCIHAAIAASNSQIIQPQPPTAPQSSDPSTTRQFITSAPPTTPPTTPLHPRDIATPTSPPPNALDILESALATYPASILPSSSSNYPHYHILLPLQGTYAFARPHPPGPAETATTATTTMATTASVTSVLSVWTPGPSCVAVTCVDDEMPPPGQDLCWDCTGWWG